MNKTPKLKQEIINEFAYHFIPTKHATERLQERFGTTDRQTIKKAILNSFFSYKNTDNSYNVAINEYEYFVFKFNEDNQPIMITFKEKSHNDITIYDKFIMALNGYDRKGK